MGTDPDDRPVRAARPPREEQPRIRAEPEPVLALVALAQRLREARLHAAMTQAQVAMVLGVTPNSVSNHERGMTEPDAEMLLRYSRLYRVPVAILRHGPAGIPWAIRQQDGDDVTLFEMIRQSYPPQSAAHLIRLRLQNGEPLATLAAEMGVPPDALERYLARFTRDGERIESYVRDIAEDATGKPRAWVVRESQPEGTRPPRVTAGLPHAIRVWLQEFLLELTKGGATDDEISDARALLTSPETFTFYVGGSPRDFSEAEVLEGMQAMAVFIRDRLSKKGRTL